MFLKLSMNFQGFCWGNGFLCFSFFRACLKLAVPPSHLESSLCQTTLILEVSSSVYTLMQGKEMVKECVSLSLFLPLLLIVCSSLSVIEYIDVLEWWISFLVLFFCLLHLWSGRKRAKDSLDLFTTSSKMLPPLLPGYVILTLKMVQSERESMLW